MYKRIMRTLLIFLTFFLPFLCEAKYDVTPKCFHDLERHFFDENVVSVALSLYNVNQGSWTSINVELQQKSRNTHERVWNEAKKQKKNPLDNKYEPDLAAVILRNVLYSQFEQACKNNFITNESNINAMFDYIEQQQAAKINACFGRKTFIPPKKEEKE